MIQRVGMVKQVEPQKFDSFSKIPESNPVTTETLICTLLSGIMWIRPSTASFVEFLNKKIENAVKNFWSCRNKKLLGLSSSDKF